MSLARLIESAARLHAEVPAVATDEVVGFAELHRRAREVAAGLEPGDRHFIQTANGAGWLVEFWGAMLAGAVAVPLNPRARPEEAAYIKEHATRPAPLAPDTAVVLYTSGTTGRPKGVMLSHAALETNAHNHAAAYRLQPGDAIFVPNPLTHILGLVVGCLVPAAAGATFVTLPAFDPVAAWRLIERWRPVGLLGAPTHFQMLAEQRGQAGPGAGSPRWGFSGAAAQSPAAIRAVVEGLGLAALMNGYGMTEASGGISHTSLEDPIEVHATTIGRPWPWIETRFEAGELWIRGDCLMLGYYDDEAATAAAITGDGWLRTGDLIDQGEDGRLRFRGRLKEMVNVGGLKVYPAEVERVLLEHPAVAGAALVGVPDERLGELPVAFVVPRAGSRFDPDELARHCQARLSGYKVPKRFEALEALPVNSAGKVQKYLLRGMAAPAERG